MSERLAATFARAKSEGRPALIGFAIPGFPTLEGTDGVFDAMVEGGADIIEIEIPFSDPQADGASIQRVAFEALERGVTPGDCIDFVRRARERHPETPIIIMTYVNPVFAYGVERFAAEAAAAGTDGMILVDLPPEEAAAFKAAFNPLGIDVVFLVSPTSSDERLQFITSQASGWIYCVSLAGVTGARADLAAGLPEFLARVRRCTDLPLAVGFGISRREHVEALTGVADGVVVGSAFMDVIRNAGADGASEAILRYTETLRGKAAV